MFKREILLYSLLVIFSMQAQTQRSDNSFSIMPPSPEVASMMKYIDFPVSLHKGQPEINLPLYTIKEGSIELPITISYHGGGIKASEYAGIVGLGWTLNAGGAVSRLVNGYPDEMISTNGVKGLFHLDERENALRDQLIEDSQKDEYAIDNVNKSHAKTVGTTLEYDRGTRDFANDIYKLSCMGLSATFIYDSKTHAITLSTPNVLEIKNKIISTNKDGNEDDFIIYNSKGHKYLFDAKEKTIMTIGFKRESVNYDEKMVYTSSWKLSKITDLAGKTVKLTYIDVDIDSMPTNGVVEYVHSWDKHIDDHWRSNGSSPVYRAKLLSSVSTMSQTVRFEYDENYMRLQTITIENSGGELVCKYQFNYNHVSEYQKKHKQLLNSIERVGLDDKRMTLYKFRYDSENNDLGNGSEIGDYWGYRNGREDYKVDVLKFTTGNPELPRLFPDLTATRKGILTHITYSTGGSTEFKWEQNDYSYIQNMIVKPQEIYDTISISEVIRHPYGVEVTKKDMPGVHKIINVINSVKLNIDFSDYVKRLVDSGSGITQWKEYYESHSTDFPFDRFYPQVNVTDSSGNILQTWFIDYANDQNPVKDIVLTKGTYRVNLLNPVNMASLELNQINAYFGNGSEKSGEHGLIRIYGTEINKRQDTRKSRDWGGLRISEIVSSSQDSENVWKKFKYNDPMNAERSSGVIFEEPKLEYTTFKSIDIRKEMESWSTLPFELVVKMTHLTSNCINQTPFGRDNVEYFCVTEEYPDGLNVRSQFSTYRQFPDEIIAWFYGMLPGGSRINTSRHHLRGSLLGKDYVNETGIFRSSFWEYSHEEGTSPLFTPNALRICDWSEVGLVDSVTHERITSDYVLTPYRLLPYYNRPALSSTSEWRHGVEMADSVFYDYYSNDVNDLQLVHLVKSISRRNSLGKTETTYITYFRPPNLTGGLVTTDLKETEVTVCEDRIISAYRFDYDSSLNLTAKYVGRRGMKVKPEYRFGETFRATDLLLADIDICETEYRYNDRGNIVEIRRDGLPLASYLWAYCGTHPIAEALGIGYDEMCGRLPANVSQSVLIDDFGVTTDKLSLIRTALHDVDVKTIVYHWLLGAREITDSRGTTLKYDYDSFGRLKSVRDHNNYYITQFDYKTAL